MNDLSNFNNDLSLYKDAPRSSSFNKLRKKLIRQTREALKDFSMIKEEARWLVCLSGGKDSYGLLTILHDLKWRGLLPVELIAMNLDQRQPGFPADILPNYLNAHNLLFHIETQDTYSIVTDKVPEHKTYCALCSRLRRGIIYRVARELNCDTVVLGHHRDDILETFLLNLYFGHKLGAMPPKLRNDEGDLTLIRPFAYVAENDLERFSKAMNYPIIPCNLCGSQDGLQRQNMKTLLTEWEQKRPGTKENMLKAMTNVRPSHLLDRNLFDFEGL